MKRLFSFSLSLLLLLSCFSASGILSHAETIGSVSVSFDYDGEFRHGANPFTIPFFADEGEGYALASFSEEYAVGFRDVTENKDLQTGDLLVCGHRYLIEAVVSADDGYSFAAGVQAEICSDNRTFEAGFLNGTVFENGEKCMVTCEVECLPAELYSLSLFIDSPGAGTKIEDFDSVRIYGGASVSQISEGAMVNGILWQEILSGETYPAGEFFEYGRSYAVTILLEADEQHVFSTDTFFIINGSTVYPNEDTVYAHNDPERYAEVSYIVGDIEAAKIQSVDIFARELYIDENSVNADLRVPENANYYIEDYLWFDGSTPVSAQDYIWGPISQPKVRLTVRSSYGWVFLNETARKTAVFLNGQSVPAENVSFEYNNERLVVTCSFDAPKSKAIDSVDVIMTSPFLYSRPSEYEFYTPKGAHYEIDPLCFRWWDGDDEVDENHLFTDSSSPEVVIRLRPTDGFYFDIDVDENGENVFDCFVNGQKAYFAQFNDDESIDIYYVFGGVSEARFIPAIHLYIDEPCTGADPYKLKIRIPAEADYDLISNNDGTIGFWYDSELPLDPGDAFSSESRPVVSVYLKPGENAEFLRGVCENGDCLLQAFVNGQPAEVQFVGNGQEHTRVNVNFSFGRVNQEPVAIRDVVMSFETPYEGCDPYALRVGIPDGEHYAGLTKVSWNGPNNFVDWNGVYWTNANLPEDDDILLPGSYYAYGDSPAVRVYLRANEGYVFDTSRNPATGEQNLCVTVNGREATEFEVYGSGGRNLYFYFTFDSLVSGDAPIDAVEITVDEPFSGGDPGDLTAVAPAGANYRLWQGMIWSDGTRELEEGETFASGALPTVEFYLHANEGFRFVMGRDENGGYLLNATVNGKKAEVLGFFGAEHRDMIVRFVFDRLEPLIDLNLDGSMDILDVTALLNILAGVAEAPQGVNADLDGVSGVSIGDVTYLLNLLAQA